MRRPTRLVLLGLLSLTTAFALPFVDFVTADWDRDYRYRAPTDGFCADAVDEPRAGTAADSAVDADFVVDRTALPTDVRRHVRRAETNGSYVVETDPGGPFSFPSDYQARGEGCYAVRDTAGGDTRYRTLVTDAVTHRADPSQVRAVRLGSQVAAALGGLSLLAGVGLGIRRRWRRR
ncbi:hypothetical protein [Salinigranum marinum]|uniref:hypothetical protein n=1 Tax=Salinigranum marinum TaxID=1515595 RepID=UPI002989B60C|nr:hypothetical protein [Salinigranum marinum]